MKEFTKYEKRGAYHWYWLKNNIDQYRDQMDFVLTLFPGKGRILDAGCGDGVASILLANIGNRVVGVDNNKLAVDFANDKRKNGVNVSTGKLRNVSFECGSILNMSVRRKFDYVLCHGVLEHMEEPEKAFELLYRMARKYMIIMVPNVVNYKKSKYDHKAWNSSNISELVGKRKYEILKAEKLLYVKIVK